VKKYLKIILVLVVVAAAVFLLTREIDIDRALQIGGPLLLALILFAETGLLVGFFLPGDTLLFAAGFFAAQGRVNLALVLGLMFLGTVLGNMLGYTIGKKSGSRIFKNEDALLLNPENITHAQNFYKKHGGKTILIARFIPVVRTIVPPLAGIAKMNYKWFTIYNLIGGAIWVSLVTMIGYWAGKVLGEFFNIDKYILPVVIFATLFSLAVSFWHIWKDPSSRAKLKKSARQHWHRFTQSFKK
jgi:membrane-associated protein